MIAQYAIRKVNDYDNLSNVKVGVSSFDTILIKVLILYIRKEEVKVLRDVFAAYVTGPLFISSERS